MNILSKVIACSLAILSTYTTAGSFLLEDYNLVTIDSVNSNNLHVDGRSLIGGDVNVQNSIVLGQNVHSGLSAAIGGEFNARNGVNAGSGSTVIVDNNRDAYGNRINQVSSSGNQTRVNGSLINNASVITGDLSRLSQIVEDNLTNFSTDFNNLEANSSFVEVRDNVTGISFDENLGATDYAILDIDYDALFGNNQNQQIEILANTTNSVEGIIINVAGTNIRDFNFIGGNANNTTNVLFNFYEATTISLSRQFFGSILAPLATLTASNNVEGSVGVLSLGTNHTGEIHDFLTTVSLPDTPDTPDTPETPDGVTEVPEPLTWVLFISLALITYQIRHRKNV